MLRYLWISVFVLVLDQASKFAAVRFLVRHEEVPLLPFLNLTLAYNAGAAFGFLSSASGWQNLFFIAIATTASVLMLVWLRRLHGDRLVAIGLCLILGGAIGNLVDRLMYGYVVDFIDVVFGSWHFWTFNIADAAINVGAVLLILDALGISTARKT